MSNVIFVTGIDTDAGKSYATGWYARMLMQQGKKVVTQKFVQTGNEGMSEDIEVHRRIMGTGLLPEDLDHTTDPLIFSYPASPQLAAAIDNKPLDLKSVDRATRKLKKRFDTVLIEGAGGLMVPLADDFLTIDYIQNRNIPIALVTNARLGSISHTLLALDTIRHRNLRLEAVLYNEHFDNDPMIAPDTYAFIARYLKRHFRDVKLIRVPSIDVASLPVTKGPEIKQPKDQPLQLSISKLDLADMPQVTFPGTISVIEHETQAREALAWLNKQKIVGLDTETRPSFRKGRTYNPSLVQISTPRRCFLFRIHKLGFIPELRRFLENEKVLKIGLSLKDDFHVLRKIQPDFAPKGYVDLQQYVREFNIVDLSLQKIYGIVFGKRISKNQRLSNWEAPTLSEGQQTYAAIDAWACLKLYQHLQGGKFDPQKSPYQLKPEE